MTTTYLVPAPLAVHTAWLESDSMNAPTRYVYVVNSSRRRIVPIALACVLGSVVLGLVVPEIAIYCALVSVGLVVSSYLFGNSGGSGFYAVGADGNLGDRLSNDQVETSGLTRRRVRWF